VPSAAFIGTGAAMHHTFVSLYVWAVLTLVTCLAPVAHVALSTHGVPTPLERDGSRRRSADQHRFN